MTTPDIAKLGKPHSPDKVSLARTVYVLVTAILRRQQRPGRRTPAERAFDIVANATLKGVPRSGEGLWAWLMQQDEGRFSRSLPHARRIYRSGSRGEIQGRGWRRHDRTRNHAPQSARGRTLWPYS